MTMEASHFSAIHLKKPFNNRAFCSSQEQMHLPRPGFDNGRILHQHFCIHHRRLFGVALHSDYNRVETQALPAFHAHRQTSRQPARSRMLRPCHVTREESGGSLSGESILQNEQTLGRELQNAIEQENYTQAAKIRDSLKLLQEDSKASVLAANAKFYNSFRNGDLAAMQSLWSKGEHVCVVHPGVSGISGYDLVMGSWEFVWADYEFPLEIETKDVQVHVRGDIGYLTCIEMVRTKGSSWGRHFATNVFEKINGQWFICIHHASYVDL